MRVLHITHSYYPRVGGIEHHVQSIATQLMTTGVQSHVLTPRWSPDHPAKESVAGISIVREELPGMMQNIPLSARDSYRLRCWVRAIREVDPDLVHVHGPFSPIFGPPVRWASWSPIRLMQLLGLLDAPVVVTFHGLWAHYVVDPYDRDRKHVKIASALIGVDRTICRDLTRLYLVPATRVNYIPNGVDTHIFHPGGPDAGLMNRLGILESEPVILVPRRLDPKNGIENAIRAFGHVVRQVPNAKLILLGFGMGTSDPGYTQRILSLLSQLDLGSRVVRHPGLSHKEMALAYRSATVAVIPSLWEATSLSALESLACGTPVIASRIGGLPDLIDDTCGVLVDPGNEHALARAMLELLTDEAARARLGQGGIQRSSRYSWSQIAVNTKSVYEQALMR